MNENILDYYYQAYKEEYLYTDPVMFPHQYSSENNKEIVGLISALMAIGNVKQIQRSINKILEELNPDPYETLKEWKIIENSFLKKRISHRFFDTYTILSLLYAIHYLINKNGRLKNYFVPIIEMKDDLKEALTEISQNFLRISLSYYNCEKKLKLLYSSPKNGSACKRWLLFLRWMIRKDDGVDFGLWDEIPPSILIIPVDVHICRIAKSIGLTKRKNPSWKMAEEITNNLKKLDPKDPVKYDFALTRIGILKQISYLQPIENTRKIYK